MVIVYLLLVELAKTPFYRTTPTPEDLGYGEAMYWSGPDAPIRALWNAITMPALVLRARQEIMPGFGSILPAAEIDAVVGQAARA